MIKLEDESRTPGHAIGGLFRGVFVGAIAVLAIAVWAVNFDAMFSADGKESVLAIAVRAMLCDAIPIATLFAVYRGISQNRSAEGILKGILRAIFWFFGGFLVRRTTDELPGEL